MDAPDSPQETTSLRPRAFLGALLQRGGRRHLLLLALFAVLVATAGRSGTVDSATTEAPGHVATEGIRRPISPDLPLPGRQSPEALALDNVLSRYDALIRLLETRALDQPGQPDPPELDDLRALRARLYEVSRRALSAAPRDTTTD